MALLPFGGATRPRNVLQRREALRRLSATVHPFVADRILRIALDEGDDPGLRAEAFRALERQWFSGPRLAPAVARFLAGEAGRGSRGADREALRAAAAALLRAWEHDGPDPG